MTELPVISVIELWGDRPANCTICDKSILITRRGPNYGVAFYEDLVVPDDYKGEWGGGPCCKECFDTYTQLQKERPKRMISFYQVMERRRQKC